MATQYQDNRSLNSIKAYLERVSIYFAANDIADGKKVPVLLSSIGAPTYALLSDLLHPQINSLKLFQQHCEIISSPSAL